MFFLTKLFQARQKMASSRTRWDDEEKPILDHLEDLRKMIMKMVLTLLVAVSACFVFDRELLEIIRYPIKLAGIEALDGSKLPEGIQETDWAKVKDLSKAVVTLEPAARDQFLARVPADLREAVLATIYFRAALALPVAERKGFVEASAPPGRIRDLALFLAAENPDGHIDDTAQLLRMTALGPAETFTLTLKLAFFAGIVVSFPLLLWFLADFVLPGLTPRERRLVLPSVLVGFALFLGGVLFAYFIVSPRALRFFYEYSMRLGVISDWRIGQFVSFVTQFILIFGLCFELPVVVMALVKLGMLSYSSMSRTRAYAVATIFFVAALITPTTDALTLFLLGGPMVILYEICIWLAWAIERKERRQAAIDEKDWQDRMLVPAVAATAMDTTDATQPDDDAPGDGSIDGDGESHLPPLDDVPEIRPAPHAQAMPDDDSLPQDWGSVDDPYGFNDDAAADNHSGDEHKDDGDGDATPENPADSSPRGPA